MIKQSTTKTLLSFDLQYAEERKVECNRLEQPDAIFKTDVIGLKDQMQY